MRVSIGDTGKISTRSARARAKNYLSQISSGQHPKSGEQIVDVGTTTEGAGNKVTITLKEAWDRYRDAHMCRKGRSARTIESYKDHLERFLKDWLDTSLQELADDPARVARKHDSITKKNGPYIANGTMRTLRAIYNHARKTHRKLPADNPVNAIDWNGEKRRDTAMGAGDLKTWFVELAAIDNPTRREFHLFTLLSGCRSSALKEIKPSSINRRRRVLHIPRPKGGAKRAFDIPLSREVIRCLIRVARYGREMYRDLADEWIFPAKSETGHLAEQKEERKVLSKWGNELRHTFRTIGTAAGVSEFDARLLMNHAIPRVNAGYITRHKLIEDHLRNQQQATSSAVFAPLGDSILKNPDLRDWLGPRATQRAIEKARASRLDTRCRSSRSARRLLSFIFGAVRT